MSRPQELALAVRPSLLLTGGTGLIGRCLLEEALSGYRTHVVVHRRRPGALRRGDCSLVQDLAEPGAVRRVVEAAEPELIVHAGAMASLGQCEKEPAAARRLNVEVTAELAQQAAERGAYLVVLSTDQVFDGEHAPYREDDPTGPLGEYGRTKVAAEEAVARLCPDALVLRSALVLGRSRDGRSGPVDMLRAAAAGDAVRLFEDEWRTPISVHCLARCVEGLLRERPGGLLHVAGPERVDRLTLGRRIARAMGFATTLVAARRDDAGHPRPADVSLDTGRLLALPVVPPRSLAEALAELAER